MDMNNSADVNKVKQREMEEEAYWTNIEPSEVKLFAKAIPLKYVGDTFTLLSKIALKLANGKAWMVEASERNGCMVFELGWKEFVKDTSLEENDILVFRYDAYGQVCLQMLLFDQTGHEKGSMHLDQTGHEEEHIETNASEPGKIKIKKEIEVEEDEYLIGRKSGRVHFFAKVLPEGFQELLAIPQTYVRVGATVPARISLKLASGRTWTVAKSERNGSLVFKHGWEKFAKDNLLEEGILLFRYHTSPACLQVVVFDKTGFEKDKMQPESEVCRGNASNSVTNMEIPKSEPEDSSTDLHQETSTQKERKFKRFTDKAEAIFKPDIDSASNQCKTRRRDGNKAKRGSTSQPLSRRSGRNDKVMGCEAACPQRTSASFASSKTLETMLKREDVVNLDSGLAPTSLSLDDYICSKLYRETPLLLFLVSSIVDEDESYQMEEPIDLRLTYETYFRSQRRDVTEEERERATDSALALTTTQPNFLSVMQPSHVHKRFFLTIPQELVKREIPPGTKEAIVRVPPNPKTWIITLILRKFSAGLNKGWKAFVMDNNLD
ncbi:hypothetical protein Sjap_003613 [Stephania japonica]|uniref:TF-B3 domain-containing protein n=1 Tax=Stephania japonica TaxID=461633 RepID=A0AAP0KP56_9MAGN